jgi:8-amino-7-oxononanoate synthase
MLDFTSCSYLGLQHGTDELPRFTAITDGRPAALAEPDDAVALGRAVAALQGQEDGVIGASSLLLAMDALGPALHGERWRILVDAGCYATLRWAASQRRPPCEVSHHDPVALSRALVALSTNERPLLAVDGFCPGCGRVAPLAEYARLLNHHFGRLLVDDTQALGLLGPGGAGSLHRSRPTGAPILCIASLAKAFSAPLAVLSGPRSLIEAFRTESATRIYCSPPSRPAVAAGVRALVLNHRLGGQLRAALRLAIATFRSACAARAVTLLPGGFPVQTVAQAGEDAVHLVTALAMRGVRAFASRNFHDATPRLRLVITAAHTQPALEAAAAALAAAMGRGGFAATTMEARHAALV